MCTQQCKVNEGFVIGPESWIVTVEAILENVVQLSLNAFRPLVLQLPDWRPITTQQIDFFVLEGQKFVLDDLIECRILEIVDDRVCLNWKSDLLSTTTARI